MQKELPELFFVPPMECKEVKSVRDIPRGKDWQYEIKFDGFRCIATCRKGDVMLYSRNGNVFTQFPNAAEAIGKLKAKSFVLDGEVVALDAEGRSKFNALQRAKSKRVTVHFYVFDLLHLDGKDLKGLPLEKRQALLQKTFPNLPDTIHLSTELKGDLETILEKIEEFGFEGIIAKRRDSIYVPGKVPGTWVKRKIKRSDEFIIGGYMPGGAGVEEVIVGKYADGKLMFVESVGDGFIPATRREVLKTIQGLQIQECPFANLPEKKGGGRFGQEKMKEARWVKPKVVVEIAMNEWTPDKHLRHAEFRRLRKDKTVNEISAWPG